LDCQSTGPPIFWVVIVSSLGTRPAVACIISEYTTILTIRDNLTSVPPFLDLMGAIMKMEKLLYSITG
jgi:hypothetical protein